MIMSFEGKFRFLSNFWPCSIFSDGINFPTVEHAFQACKTNDWEEIVSIWNAESPGKAKRLGKKVTLRPDWDEVKLEVMENLVRQKFTRNTFLRQSLRATGDCEIIEGNNWGDTFWGVCDGVGENHLGKILMKVRSEIVLPR